MKGKLKKRLSRVYIPIISIWNDIKYTLAWLVFELPRGLDFSRRDLTPYKESGGEMCSYQKTSRRRLRAILTDPIIAGRRSFLDIGCGKGYVLKTASELGCFERLGGIEYEPRLAGICRKNLSLLGMEDIRIWEGDARSFQDYRDYDTYFMYNPFGPQIFERVLEKLPSKGTAIIYFNPVCNEMVLESGRFRLVKQLYDGRSKYPTNIYFSVE